jgi:hypothetical protein
VEEEKPTLNPVETKLVCKAVERCSYSTRKEVSEKIKEIK